MCVGPNQMLKVCWKRHQSKPAAGRRRALSDDRSNQSSSSFQRCLIRTGFMPLSGGEGWFHHPCGARTRVIYHPQPSNNYSHTDPVFLWGATWSSCDLKPIQSDSRVDLRLYIIISLVEDQFLGQPHDLLWTLICDGHIVGTWESVFPN